MDSTRRLLGLPFEQWATEIARLPADEGVEAVRNLHRVWIDGEVGTQPFTEGTGLTLADRRIGELFEQLPDSLTDSLYVRRFAQTESEVRRWCWARGWSLIEQDEDLMLMDDAYVEPLLEEARAWCPKREYALGIVEHHARDSAHQAAWNGHEALDERLRLAGHWSRLARSADAAQLSDYLERLASYAARHKVTRDAVDARVFDLRRCHPDMHLTPDVRRQGAQWIARLDRANLLRGEWSGLGAKREAARGARGGTRPLEGALLIDAGTGRMWAEPLG